MILDLALPGSAKSRMARGLGAVSARRYAYRTSLPARLTNFPARRLALHDAALSHVGGAASPERCRAESRWRRGRAEVVGEPAAREVGDRVERSRFLEQMGGTGHDSELVFAPQLGLRGAVEFDHGVVEAADDEQGRGTDLREPGGGKIRPPAARGDGRGGRCRICGGVKGGCGAGAGAEVAQKAWDAGHGAQFAGDVEQTAGEQADIEHLAPLPFLLGSEQVE